MIFVQKNPPNNMAMLLGLGSTFCVQTKKLDEKAFIIMINRFKHNVIVKQHVQDYIRACDKPAPDLYVKNTSTKLPLAPRNIEGDLNRFATATKNSFKVGMEIVLLTSLNYRRVCYTTS